MDFYCSIYDVDLRNLVKKHDLGVGKDLSRRVYFVLADSPYNVPSYQNNAHAACDASNLNDVMDMAKVWKRFIKLGAHKHVVFTL